MIQPVAARKDSSINDSDMHSVVWLSGLVPATISDVSIYPFASPYRAQMNEFVRLMSGECFFSRFR